VGARELPEFHIRASDGLAKILSERQRFGRGSADFGRGHVQAGLVAGEQRKGGKAGAKTDRR
jgi:hypothetical protein